METDIQWGLSHWVSVIWCYYGLGHYYVLFAWLYQFYKWCLCLKNFLWSSVSYFSKDGWNPTIPWLDVSDTCFPLNYNRYLGLAFLALVIHLFPVTSHLYPLFGLQSAVRTEQRNPFPRPPILTESILISQWQYIFSVEEQKRIWRHPSSFQQ